MEVNFEPGKNTMNTNLKFNIGDVLVYGTRGKHTVIAIESRTINNQTLEFLKLEPVNYAVAKRAPTNSAAILVPATTARRSGLRASCTLDEMNQALAMFNKKDPEVADAILNLAPNRLATEIEKLCNDEGALGIAKSIQILCALQRRDVAISKPLSLTLDTLLKNLSREFMDHREPTPSNEIEAELRKILKLKQN